MLNSTLICSDNACNQALSFFLHNFIAFQVLPILKKYLQNTDSPHMKFKLIAPVLFYLFPIFATAQFNSFSVGTSVIDELLPEGYQYEPVTFVAASSVWTRKRWTVYLEGQFTRAASIRNFQEEYGIGGNLGILYRQPITPLLTMMGAIGSGPYYITVQTDRQASGFIFSDNFEAGFTKSFKNIGPKLQLRFRFRHISNAGLQEPNGGIDNFFVFIGIVK